MQWPCRISGPKFVSALVPEGDSADRMRIVGVPVAPAEDTNENPLLQVPQGAS